MNSILELLKKNCFMKELNKLTNTICLEQHSAHCNCLTHVSIIPMGLLSPGGLTGVVREF